LGYSLRVWIPGDSCTSYFNKLCPRKKEGMKADFIRACATILNERHHTLLSPFVEGSLLNPELQQQSCTYVQIERE
jgi:hypothetical protein